MLTFEYERIRDFLILHYQPSQRADAFWQDVRAIPAPDSLAHRIELFRSHGRIIREETELFPAQSWLYIFAGQGITPRHADPHAGALEPAGLDQRLEHLHTLIGQSAAAMPSHESFVASHCAAETLPA
jgi:tryptophan halogenase